MLTWNNEFQIDTDLAAYATQGVCLSTDTKPTVDVANGSLLLEMDTGKIYAFNRDSAVWIELA